MIRFFIYFSVTVAFRTITGLKMMKPNFELNRMWWNIADDDFDNRCIFTISVCALFMRLFQLLLKTTKALSHTCSGAVLLVRYTAVSQLWSLKCLPFYLIIFNLKQSNSNLIQPPNLILLYLIWPHPTRIIPSHMNSSQLVTWFYYLSNLFI